MILKLTDFSKLLISYSFSIQYCRVLGHAITTKPLWQQNSFRRVPSGDIPRPGLSLSLLHRECLCSAWLPRGCSCLTALQGTEELGREESSPGDRKGFLPIAAHTCTVPSALWKPLLGHSSSHGFIFPLQKGILTGSGLSIRTLGMHLGMAGDLTKGCNTWMIQQKKAKSYKASSRNMYSKMINHENAAWEEHRKKFAGFSFQTLDRQPDPLTDAPKPSCLSKAKLVQEEAQQSLTQAEVRKKIPASLPGKNAKKGEGYILPLLSITEQRWAWQAFSAKLIPITTATHKANHKNENSRCNFRGQLHEEGSGWQLIPLLLQQCCLKWFVLSFKSGLTEEQDNGRKLHCLSSSAHWSTWEIRAVLQHCHLGWEFTAVCLKCQPSAFGCCRCWPLIPRDAATLPAALPVLPHAQDILPATQSSWLAFQLLLPIQPLSVSCGKERSSHSQKRGEVFFRCHTAE